MKKENGLIIGREILPNGSLGESYSIPTSFTLQRLAILAMSNTGKTYFGTVIAEEMAKIGIPFMAYDPTSMWYGLRVPVSRKEGFPVVVIGGKHGDLPLDKDAGKKIAHAFLHDDVSIVIDVKSESKTTWRKFLTELSLGLLEDEPRSPRHVFIEEAPDFIPQKSKFQITAQCKEAVERLVRQGGNNGIGCTLLSQRCATVDKDALSQCSNVFLMSTVGKHDRLALEDWTDAQFVDREEAKQFFKNLVALPQGRGWFWSPAWLRTNTLVQVRKRETYHPRDKWQSEGEVKIGKMTDIEESISRLKKTLSSRTIAVQTETRNATKKTEIIVEETVPRSELDSVKTERDRLRNELINERNLRQQIESKLASVKAMLAPQHELMQKVFSEISMNGSAAAADDYEIWLKKFGGNKKKILEIFIQRGRLTKQQAQILTGLNRESVRLYFSEMRRANLLKQEGEEFILQKP